MTNFFSRQEYESRWLHVMVEMKRRGFEAAVVMGRGGGTMDNCGDILYLANHYAISGGMDSSIWSARSFSGVIFQQDKAPQLHIDEPEVRQDLVSIDDVHASQHPFISIAKALTAQGVKGRVALVGTFFIPMKYYQQLTEHAPDIDWIPADDLVRSIRRIKSPRELECYRIAGKAATASLTTLMEGLIRGLPEQEAAGEAAREVVSRGGRLQMIGTNHGDTLGFDQRFPLTGYSEDAPRSGDMVTGTIHAAFYQGYYLDPGRTAVCGPSSDAQRHLIEAAANIVHQLTERLRPGTKLLDIAAEGDRLTAEFGGSVSPIMKNFPFYGHSIGLGFEQPRISTGMSLAEDRVEANMVFGIESFLAMDGVGAAFFEDIVIVGADGNEVLTQTPSTWW